MNYYERHIGDYLKGTAHLSLLEHGIYGRLLDVYYTRESGIPADQSARLIGARTPEELTVLGIVLAEFFVEQDGLWIHGRCEREVAKYKDKQDKAKRSADARWNPKPPACERNANALPTQSEGNALQSPVTSNQTPVKEEKTPRKRGVPFPLPDWINREHWDAWHSCGKRKNATNAQKQMAVDKLDSWRQEGIDHNLALENAAIGGWQGLFKPDVFKAKGPPAHKYAGAHNAIFDGVFDD